jgi:glycosyltransferase involved in cell wall biosynthesis
VEDRCNDNTYDLLLEETKKDTRLRVVHVNHKPEHINGKKYALTLGIKAAKYDWVLLTDADCRPASTEWISQMASGFSESTSIVLGYSPYLPQPGFLNTFIRFETILTAIQYFALSSLAAPYMGVGRNLAYRKKLFLENKGFNDHIGLTGGDDDLFVNSHATHQNTFTVLNEKAIVYSKPKTSWATFFQQKIRHLSVGKHYKLKHRLMLAPFAMSWLLLWPSAIVLMFTLHWEATVAVILLRWALQILTVSQFTKKTGEQFNFWKIPLLDYIFGFYYLVAGLKALVSKSIQWKT